MTENDDGLKSAVEQWLNNQGYPLEMYVAKVFSDFGLRSRQGWYFSDPEDEKPREIDVLGSLDKNTGHPGMFQIIAECKRIESPFVVFTYSNRTHVKPEPTIHQGNVSGKNLINKMVDLGVIDTLPLFRAYSPLGYDMKQIPVRYSKKSKDIETKSSKNNAFDALMKVSKATFSIVQYFHEKHPRVKKPGDDITSYVLAYIAVPIIVIDGPLYDCYLEDSGKLHVTSISSALINWSYPLLGNVPIRIYKKESLQDFMPIFIESVAKVNELDIYF